MKEESQYTRLFEEPASEEQQLEVRQSCSVETFTDLHALIMRYSKLYRLQRAACWLGKLSQYVQRKAMYKEISVSDLEAALNNLIRFVQKQQFSDEWKALEAGKQVQASSKLKHLCPKLIDGLLCVGGRLENASDDINKHPIILGQSHLTTLIIRAVHVRNAHVGTNHVHSLLREKYHILKGYSLVKSVLNSCVQCKKSQGQPTQQVMGQLPKERVNAEQKPPFTYVGVDYFGPMNVKYRRGTVKRYGCLFTCLTTRAVHIEVAHSLDADSFLMALHRFIARRGKPQKIFSDNGTNFVAADRELAEEIRNINTKKLKNEMLLEAIEWSFNPPHAPHMGGV